MNCVFGKIKYILKSLKIPPLQLFTSPFSLSVFKQYITLNLSVTQYFFYHHCLNNGQLFTNSVIIITILDIRLTLFP